MVSPKPVETNDTAPVKKNRKKKKYPGETVADRLLEYARRLEEMRISENNEAKTEQPGETAETSETSGTSTAAPSQPVTTGSTAKSKTKMDSNMKIPTHEIDDLSALEWETSSEQSGH